MSSFLHSMGMRVTVHYTAPNCHRGDERCMASKTNIQFGSNVHRLGYATCLPSPMIPQDCVAYEFRKQ